MQENFIREILLKRINELKNIRTPQNVERARVYIVKAKTDLKSAEILYKNEIFDNSIFMFQQSVEKATKCHYILWTGASEHKLKEISHKSPLALLKILENFFKTYSNEIKLLFPDSNHSLIDNFELKTQVSEIDRMRIAKMDKKSIMKLVKSPKNFMLKKISNFDKKESMGDLIKYGLEFDYARNSLFILAHITFPHAMSTRYPGEVVNLVEYKKGLGIVDAAPELFNELKRVLPIVERGLRTLKFKDFRNLVLSQSGVDLGWCRSVVSSRKKRFSD